MSAYRSHLICEICWNAKRPGRRPTAVTGVIEDATLGLPAPCCFCGTETSSRIYVRAHVKDTPHCSCKDE